MHKKINAILIPVLMILLLAAFFLLPAKDFSERENRYLAPLPRLSLRTVTDGSFMEDIADYASDHFPMRDFFLGINTGVSRARGKTLVNGVYFSDDDYLIEKYEASGNMAKIARVVNAFTEKVKDNADVTFMAVPTSALINRDKLPAGADGSAQAQEEELGELYSQLGCNAVALLDELSDLGLSEQVFYRLDHHWTTPAAKAAYEAYRRLLDGSAYSQGPDYEYAKVSESFRGTLFNKVGECGLGSDDILVPLLSSELLESVVCTLDDGTQIDIFDETKLATADQYGYFLSGNHPFMTITVEEGAEGKPDILVIKDSYANCMIPFMLRDYHSITVIDPRYYGDSVSSYVNGNGIEEVLFVYNMNTLGTDLGIRRVQ